MGFELGMKVGIFVRLLVSVPVVNRKSRQLPQHHHDRWKAGWENELQDGKLGKQRPSPYQYIILSPIPAADRKWICLGSGSLLIMHHLCWQLIQTLVVYGMSEWPAVNICKHCSSGITWTGSPTWNGSSDENVVVIGEILFFMWIPLCCDL